MSDPFNSAMSTHQQLASKQIQTYLQQKQMLASGLALDEAILIQDFSQFSLNKGFQQDLIITIYTYDPEAPD